MESSYDGEKADTHWNPILPDICIRQTRCHLVSPLEQPHDFIFFGSHQRVKPELYAPACHFSIIQSKEYPDIPKDVPEAADVNIRVRLSSSRRRSASLDADV